MITQVRLIRIESVLAVTVTDCGLTSIGLVAPERHLPRLLA